MNRGDPHDDAIHEEINAEAIENAADNRMGDHEPQLATGEVVNGGSRVRNQEVKEETEGSCFQSALKGVLAKRAARDRLQNSDRCNVISDSEKHARVSDIESAGNQSAGEDWFDDVGFRHLSFDSLSRNCARS